MADNETSYLPIDTCLEQIEKAVYGREVRKAIHDGIAQCHIIVTEDNDGLILTKPEQ